MAQVQIDTEMLNTIGKIEPEHSLDRSILRLLEKEVVRKIIKYRFISVFQYPAACGGVTA